MYELKNNRNKNQLILMIFIIIITMSLMIWIKSPIYPDELAFRISKLRYINDGYKIYDLNGVCNLGVVELPIIFKPAAWILSAIANKLNPFLMRIMPLLSMMMLVISLIFYTSKQQNKKARFYIAFAFIGVAGSSVVIVRYEFIILLQIAVCLLSISFYKNNIPKIKISYLLMIAILCITTLSCYVHPQGILFVPLSVFALNELANTKEKNKIYLKIILMLLITVIVFGSLKFNKIGCIDSKEMNESFNGMVLNLKDDVNVEFITTKIKKYVSSFTYNKEYLTNYLPGVLDVKNKEILEFINYLIEISLIIILLLNIYHVAYAFLKIILNKTKNKILVIKKEMLVFCLIGPALFLMIYDKNQYFYRSIFINIVFCVSLVVIMSNKESCKNTKSEYALILYGIGLLILSAISNYKLFYNMLVDWNAIYSVSIKNALVDRTDNIKSIIDMCGVDLKKGRVVLDEYTYDYFKSLPNPHIIYYISHQSNVTRKSNSEVMSILGVSAVVASCSSMKRSGVGWPPNYSRQDVCCYKPEYLNK